MTRGLENQPQPPRDVHGRTAAFPRRRGIAKEIIIITITIIVASTAVYGFMVAQSFQDHAWFYRPAVLGGHPATPRRSHIKFY